jgi:sulfur carrier protein ThiS
MKKIEITLEFMGALRRPTGVQRKANYTFEEPITISQLLDLVGFSPPEKTNLVVIVNKTTQKSLDYIIMNGDKIKVTMPIGGG